MESDEARPRKRPLFRKEALERLASPDELHELLVLTRRRTWIALAALFALLCCVVAWSFVGRVPTTVSGQGILLRTGGMKTVRAKEAGRVIKVTKRVGMRVEPGDAVVELIDVDENAEIERSAYGGTIVDVLVNEGDVIDRGDAVMAIVDEEAELAAVLYFAPADGKKIGGGMPVEVSPSTAEREIFGFARGVVSRVGAYPKTREGMVRVLQNEKLVEQLSLGGAPIEVDVELTKDPTTPTGFAWSAGKGPQAMTSGTPVTARVTLREQPPIVMLIPALGAFY